MDQSAADPEFKEIDFPDAAPLAAAEA